MAPFLTTFLAPLFAAFLTASLSVDAAAARVPSPVNS
jgi:hypothetical protein